MNMHLADCCDAMLYSDATCGGGDEGCTILNLNVLMVLVFLLVGNAMDGQTVMMGQMKLIVMLYLVKIKV